MADAKARSDEKKRKKDKDKEEEDEEEGNDGEGSGSTYKPETIFCQTCNQYNKWTKTVTCRSILLAPWPT